MAVRKSTFYLARIVHIGPLTPEEIAQAIRDSAEITYRRYTYSFIDPIERRDHDGKLQAVFGSLAKYSRDGEVDRVDRAVRSKALAAVPDLLTATSEFVYLPEYSGVAFQHVWNKIEKDTFASRFAQLVVQSLNLTLVDVRLSLVSEYRELFSRISTLERIERISSRVVPPNPLYGHLWKPLRSYLDSRQVGELKVDEAAEPEGSLKSELPVILGKIVEGTEADALEPPKGIGDAAFLMAADGYGNGKVRGVEDGALVEVSTRDMDASFKLEKDAEVDALETHARNTFASINQRRGLEEP